MSTSVTIVPVASVTAPASSVNAALLSTPAPPPFRSTTGASFAQSTVIEMVPESVPPLPSSAMKLKVSGVVPGGLLQ